MKKKIVFLDLDKTTIDKNYQLTTSEIFQTVKKCEENGVEIILSSDSALKTLQQWANVLDIKGRIVAEKGALIYDPKTNTKVMLNDYPERFLRLREDFIVMILKLKPESTIFIGDSTEFIRKKIRETFFGKRVLVVNGYREASFSVFVRKYDAKENKLMIDNDLMSFVNDHITVLALNDLKEKFEIDANLDYGIIIAHSLETSKSNAVREILNRDKDIEKVYAIGDSMADFVSGFANNPVIQCAVANADELYKNNCRFISKHYFTAGVVDFLDLIVNDII